MKARFQLFVARHRERILLKLARMLPRELRYWATIVSGAEATTGQYGSTVVSEITFVDVLQRIER